MKKNIAAIILFISFLLVFFPYVVLAEEATPSTTCTQEEKMRLQQLALLTKVTYQMADCTDEYGFPYKAYKINISGFTNDFYIWQSQRGILIEYQNNIVASSTCFLPGETIQLPFYASSNSVCKGHGILTKTVALPHYNKHSEDPLCIGHEEYELCKKYSPIVISYEDFLNRINQHIKSLETKKDNGNENDEVNTNNKNIWEFIVKFLIANILYITIPIILIGITAIVIIKVRNRRSVL